MQGQNLLSHANLLSFVPNLLAVTVTPLMIYFKDQGYLECLTK